MGPHALAGVAASLRGRAAGLLLVVASCTGDGGGPNEVSRLSDIQTEIFDRRCAFLPCHASIPQFDHHLDLRAGYAHRNLVRQPAHYPGKIRVVPGHPETSFLIEKLTSDHPTPIDGMNGILSNQRMPRSCDQVEPPNCLSDDQVEKIRGWILAGAPAR